MLARLAQTTLALFALAAPLIGHAQQAAPERFVAGTHYFVLPQAQSTSTGDKVEVLELFSYACPHCAEFQPYVNAWKKKMPKDASFVLMPVAWNAQWENCARAYYAADALGIAEKNHDPLFHALHVEGKYQQLVVSVDALAGWYAEHGADKQTFIDTANSFAINTKISRTKQLVPKYAPAGTPSLVIAGKYRIDVSPPAVTMERMFEIADFLVAKEVAARGPAKPAAEAPKPATPTKH